MTDKIILNQRNGFLGWWPKGQFRAIFDPENARIKEFLIENIVLLPEKSIILDAGAGSKPYQSLFKNHHYTSTDFPQGFYKQQHDFECHLDDIPQPDNTYDCVLLTQVLEHVPNPYNVLKEIHRVLKPGGKLLLSVPLNTPLHGEPYHYFNFTHYGISQLAEETQFKVTDIEKIGGAFWNLGKRLPEAFIRIFKQYDPFRAKKRKQQIGFTILMNIMLLPIYFTVYLPAQYLFRPMMYWFDRLDIQKSFTLGYTAVLTKL